MGIFKTYVSKTNDTDLSESRLWVDFLEGDARAFENIYTAYFNKLYNYGVHLCKDQSLVEDCIQELFLDLWNRRDNLSLAKSVKYYLFKSLRRRIVRSLGQRKQIYLHDELQGSSDFSIISPYEAQRIREEEHQRSLTLLSRASKSLSAKQREAIFLKFHSNLSYKEIADVMKLTLPDAYKTISRAVEKLRKGILCFSATSHLIEVLILSLLPLCQS